MKALDHLLSIVNFEISKLQFENARLMAEKPFGYPQQLLQNHKELNRLIKEKSNLIKAI